MKIEIWDGEQEEEQILRLRLLPDIAFSGDVVLAAVDKHGQKLFRGCLLSISTGGGLSLRGCISEKLGLQLNSRGELEVV